MNEALPLSVRRILIVGAGGFGREVLHWARTAWPHQAAMIAGFLAADGGTVVGRTRPLPILADPGDFAPEPDDALILAIGIPGVRRRVAENLLARNATFVTVVHPTAVVADTAVIGRGSVICPGAVVSDAARVGRFGIVNYHASLAHDACIGDFAVLSPYAALGGGAEIGADAFLGLHAAVGPGVSIGPRSKVSAGAAALADVPADSLAYGVPARIGPLLP